MNEELYCKIENKKEQFGHDFRAKTFYFDGSAVLYSDYKNLKISICFFTFIPVVFITLQRYC